MLTINGPEELKSWEGKELGVTEWMTVSQERINQFADATGDHQWIHVDVERAKKESPMGGPIAHGYLTLSLIPMFKDEIYTVEGAKAGLNYGLNSCRFLTPVPAGGRVRGQGRRPLPALQRSHHRNGGQRQARLRRRKPRDGAFLVNG